jgi:membrane protein YqaA with SNARE-associated domain
MALRSRIPVSAAASSPASAVYPPPITTVPEAHLVVAPKRRSLLQVVLTLGALGALSALFLFVPIDYQKVGDWGYLGIFIVVFIATASFILPIPYLLIVARAGIFLDPWLLAGVAGLAAALGEMTGYLVGVTGSNLIARGKWYCKAEHWLSAYGFWCIAVFSFIPNPFFDAIGFAAGILRYSIWRFMVACFIGKGLKFLLAAFAGDQAHIFGLL